MILLCVRHGGTAILTFRLGLLNPGPLRAQSPLCTAGSHFGISSPTDSNRIYHFLTSSCFRCSSAYLHKCISWLTARSRVNIWYSSLSYFSKFHMWTFSSRPSPPPHILQITLKDNNSKNTKRSYLNNSKINKKILIRRRPSHYVTLGQANYYLNLFHTILCVVSYPDMQASRYNTDASFILLNTIGPAAIPWRISKP